MIDFKNIKKAYDKKIVLDIPELIIPEGEVFGLVGNNGAGKTTAFSLVLDLIAPSQGEVLSKSENVRLHENWKKYTSAFLDESFLIDFLTPDEYFHFIGKLYGWNKSDTEQFVHRFTEFFNDEIIGVKKFIRDLSKGNQKKVGLVASLIGNPEIVILDEPFASLDPSSQIRFKNIVKEYAAEKTFLISSHDLNHVTEVCDRIVVLEKGQIVKDIQTDQVTLKELESYFAV